MRGLRDLCRRAKTQRITLYLQNRAGRWRGSVPEILQLIDDVGADNLRFALNTACADVRDALTQAGDRLGMVLAAAPSKVLPEMQRPVSEGGVDLSALKTLNLPVVLDGEYAGPDDVLRDVKALWDTPNNAPREHGGNGS